MRQVLQTLGDGKTELTRVPVPAATPSTLVVESRASVLSSGTERMLVGFGRASLFEKARQQPDRVREVLNKVRTDGLGPTLEAVRSKLEQPIPLGYCQAGVVRSVGGGVEGFAEGDRVVTNGPHSEFVRIPWTLAARVPEDVSFDAAAFTPLAAIGLQGLRLAEPTLGETMVVYGLGLIGLLTVQLARANGCRVIGIDRLPDRLALAESFGAEALEANDSTDLPDAVRQMTGGVGADAVLLTLATDSDEPARNAARMSRKRGRLVLVGVAGLDLDRADFYEKELSFQVSCSYGPGRYDPAYEAKALDYPLPYVRWTEGRNFEAVLRLMAEGRLDPLPLVTHRFPFEHAPDAYDLILSEEPGLGVVLDYSAKSEEEVQAGRTVRLKEPRSAAPARGVVGFIGAGNFASRVLMPAFEEAGAILHTVVSTGGTSAAVAAKKHGFERATTDPEVLFQDPDIDTVVIATRHDTHAEYVLRGLKAGKHVFVEKPLAIREEDIDRIEAALRETDRILCVGFNRRFAPLTLEAREALEGRTGPLVVNITVNAGPLPDDHWTRDPQVGGGRLVGEACHFVDLAQCFVDSGIDTVNVISARDSDGAPVEDISLIQMGFADGSIATIQYLANGPKAFPKERVELFWDGKAIGIDNWRKAKGWGVRMGGTPRTRKDRKGHDRLVAAYIAAVRSCTHSPMPMGDILRTNRSLLSPSGANRESEGTV